MTGRGPDGSAWDTEFLQGGGGMGQRIRAFDWASTPLGPPDGWPQALRTLMGLMLCSSQPMFVAWGPARTLIYNDGYAPLCGARHPAALGRPFAEVWHDVMPVVGPILEQAFQGDGTQMDDLRLLMHRNGYPEETHFAFSYTPVRDETGTVQGVFCACTETTERVFADRRERFLAHLADRLRAPGDPLEVMGLAAEALGRHLGVAQVGYSEFDEDASHIIISREWGDGRIPSVVGRHRLADFGEEVGAALRRGNVLVLEDVEQDRRTLGQAATAFTQLSIRAVLAVPLVKAGRPVATLFLHHPRSRNWPPLDQDLVRQVAERTWAAVERARAEATLRQAVERERRRAHQLQLVARASLDVTASRSLDQTLHIIAAAAREIIGAHQSVVSLTSGAGWGQGISAFSLSDRYERWRSFTPAPDGSGIYAVVCETNRPMRLTQAELEAHPRWRSFGGHRPDHPPMRGWLAAPLVARDGRNLGLVQLSDREDAGEFDAQDEAILVQLAQLAPAAVERQEVELALRESERRLKATWDNAGVGICVVDAQGCYVAVNDTYTRITGYRLEDLGDASFLDLLPDPDDAERTREEFARLVRGEVDHIERERLDVDKSGRRWWAHVHNTAVRDEAGRFLYAVRVVQDISARKADEARQQLLAREVDHRAKNVLAVVQAVLRLTRADSPVDFVAAVEGRVAALARAHGRLAQNRWTGADLRALAEEELAPYLGATGQGRARLTGPAVTLAPDAVQPAAMVLHELSTNAAKHGALSVLGGQVVLGWGAAPGGGVRLVWRERLGPVLAGVPTRRGFGSEMITAAAAQLGGRAEFAWDREGLCCSLTISPENLADRAAADGPDPRTTAPATRLEGRRVLVAEDDAILAMTMRRMLEELGCEVVGPAGSLGEVLRLAADERRLDAALLDVNLHGREVWPAADLLTGRGVPLVYITGYGQEAGRGDAPVLEKPVSPARLGTVLAELLSGEPPMTQAAQ